MADPHDHQAEGLEELVEEEVVSEILFIQSCHFHADQNTIFCILKTKFWLLDLCSLTLR